MPKQLQHGLGVDRKVDPHGRGLKGIFVGIADFHHTTYILWIPPLDSFIESRDVTFDEEKSYLHYKADEGFTDRMEDGGDFELEPGATVEPLDSSIRTTPTFLLI